MRQLIDVSFKDTTSYPPQASEDIGGIIIDHIWGPSDKIVTVDLPGFLRTFPQVQGEKLTPSYLNAMRALQSGLRTIECVRHTKEPYFVIPLKEEEPASTALDETTALSKANHVLVGRYKGMPAEYYDSRYDAVIVKVAVFGDSRPDSTFPEDHDIAIGVFAAVGQTLIALETLTGSLDPNYMVEGRSEFIADIVNRESKYLQYLYNEETNIQIDEDSQIELELSTSTSYKVPTEVLAALYGEYFSDIEVSQVSILIDPGSVTTDDSARYLLDTADKRSDCVALIGYPTSEDFTSEDILTFKQSLTPTMYGAFYAVREQIKIGGRNYLTNGIGTIAGRIANVANSDSVNQLPSAKSYGAFGSPIKETLSFDEVLKLHKLGVNSVYASVAGPRIFGLKSLHAKESSYFSKFNVTRVTARILKYAFNIAMDVIHTGNTDQRKALTQNLLNADLDRLKALGALRVQSRVICDNSNNHDLDTNGGEILNIDYECWFVKLIEKVKINITATDSSVSATVTQG